MAELKDQENHITLRNVSGNLGIDGNETADKIEKEDRSTHNPTTLYRLIEGPETMNGK